MKYKIEEAGISNFVKTFVNSITSKSPGAFQKMIDNDPEIKRLSKEIERVNAEIAKHIKSRSTEFQTRGKERTEKEKFKV